MRLYFYSDYMYVDWAEAFPFSLYYIFNKYSASNALGLIIVLSYLSFDFLDIFCVYLFQVILFFPALSLFGSRFNPEGCRISPRENLFKFIDLRNIAECSC